ncbi:MFS multidrug transporter [Aspergillus flavus]|nr:MFS multidrug transporter [Aspergillus flavus]
MAEEVNERTRLLSQSDDPSPSLEELEEWEEPRNWKVSYRWLCIAVISVYGLISPVIAAIIVPAMPQIATDLNVTDPGMLQAFVSVYVLGWSFAPLVVGPLSEVYGRISLLNTGHGLFLVFNALCAFARSDYELLILRFITGAVGSAPLSIGAGIIGDLWAPEERGLSISLYTLGPLLGPAIAPITGAYIVSHTSWRAIFAWCSLYILITWVVGLCTLRETFRPVLIQRKQAAAVRRGQLPGSVQQHHKSLADVFRQDLRRPFTFLGTQPIIQVLSLFMGYLFGLNHLSITTFESVWTDIYNQTPSRAALNYISIAGGFILGSQITGSLNDRIYIYYTSKDPAKGTPELRTILMLPAALLVPTGLLIYGWSAQTHSHWIMPNIGIGIYALGLIMSYQCIQAYVLDCYAVYAASAMGALTILRSLLGFVLPILAPLIYRTLGYGWGSSLLALWALVMGGLVPVLLWRYGAVLRKRSGILEEM